MKITSINKTDVGGLQDRIPTSEISGTKRIINTHSRR